MQANQLMTGPVKRNRLFWSPCSKKKAPLYWRAMPKLAATQKQEQRKTVALGVLGAKLLKVLVLIGS